MASRDTLERVLCEDVPNIRGMNIWIWGAGNTAQLYQEGLNRLSQEGFCFEGYIDRAFSEKGEELNGKRIISPDEVKELKNICVLICSSNPEVAEEIGVWLNKNQIKWHLIDEVVLKWHYKEVLRVYDLLCDRKSKDVYADIIIWRVTGKILNMEFEPNSQYFALEPFRHKNPKEIFIDCGAYIGDTIEKYLENKEGCFKKIIAFEPDEVNFNKLSKQVENMKRMWNVRGDAIELHCCGVGEKTEELGFERYDRNCGVGSKFLPSVSDGMTCKVISLDEYLSEPYSFLKADVESYEYQMLLGAEKGIRRFKPLLAICIYHNAVDMYSIPLLVKKMVPEYNLVIKQHLDDLSETVLYAWI